MGSVAALEHPRRSDAATYGEVFLRDNVPVMPLLLIQGRFEVVKHFLEICLDLQSSAYQTRGVFPTSFVEEETGIVADYGQRSIDRSDHVGGSQPVVAGAVLAVYETEQGPGVRLQSESAARRSATAGSGAPSNL